MKRIVVILLMAMMLPLSIMAISFSDLKTDFWAYQDIEELTELHVINGYPDGSFKPQNHITRAEFIKLMALISDKKEEVKELGFLEQYNLKKHWAYSFIETCAKKGLIDSFDNPLIFNLTEVDKPILRAEMALLIARNFEDSSVNQETDLNDLNGLDEKQEEAIKKAYQNKIITGYPDKSFKPYGKSTRAEAVAMLNRYIGVKRINKADISKNALAQQKPKEINDNEKYEKDLTYLNKGERWYQGGTPKDDDVRVENGKKLVYVDGFGWINWEKHGQNIVEESKGKYDTLSGIKIGY